MMAKPSRLHHLVITAALVALTACGSDRIEGPPPPTGPVLLKDVVVSTVPSPYYHFEYDAEGRVSAASFASGSRSYDVAYDGGRIVEMRSNAPGNHDRLVFVYDDAGRVTSVRYTGENGIVFTVLFLTYTGQQLTHLERDVRVTGGFVIDKTMSFSYYADGNLLALTEHRPAIDGLQPETNTVDRFEGYDRETNVDSFDLIHDDFFDHLVLLPGVQLQKGNPARQTRTGDGDNFQIDYTYAYDGKRRPTTKSGDLLLLSGPLVGRHYQLSTVFTYYD